MAAQKHDKAIAQAFYLAQIREVTSDLPSLGTNLVSEEKSIQKDPKP